MEELYHDMMVWALGENYQNDNVRNAPEVWKTRHPEFPELKELAGKPSGPNGCFFIFQITNYWLEVHSTTREGEHDQVKARAIVNTASGFTSLIKSFFMWLFKRKSRA